jgi:threonine dehydrogenase-like Zn-dependent dehydrogenase
MSLDLGALLEPLSVAIQASKRAQLAPGSTILVFGAGAVGLLVAAMAKISGAGTVVIADIDAGRVQFAVDNKFAHRSFTVPMKRGNTIEEQLEIAKEVAAEVGKLSKESGGEIGEVDAVFECTGVPSCVQASIYVSCHQRHGVDEILTHAGNATRWQGSANWHGYAHSDTSHICSCSSRGRYPRCIQIREHVPHRY